MDQAQQSTPELAAIRGDAPPPSRRRMVRYCFVFLGLLAGIGLARLWGYWLWQSEPIYWQQHQQYLQRTTAAERLALAESVERRILGQLSFLPTGVTQDRPGGAWGDVARVRDEATLVTVALDEVAPDALGRTEGSDRGGTRAILLTVEEINAWMDQRLGDWASNQGWTIPDDVSDPMLALEGENLVFAFRVDRESVKQVVSVVTRLDLDGDGGSGQAKIHVLAVRGGRLKIPGVKAVSRAMEKRNAQDSNDAADLASKITEAMDGQSFDPVMNLHSQVIHVVAIEPVLEPKMGLRLSFKAKAP